MRYHYISIRISKIFKKIDNVNCIEQQGHLFIALPICLLPPCFLQNGGDSIQLGMKRKFFMVRLSAMGQAASVR